MTLTVRLEQHDVEAAISSWLYAQGHRPVVCGKSLFAIVEGRIVAHIEIAPHHQPPKDGPYR